MMEGILLMTDDYSEDQGFLVCGGRWLVCIRQYTESCKEVRVQVRRDGLGVRASCGSQVNRDIRCDVGWMVRFIAVAVSARAQTLL